MYKRFVIGNKTTGEILRTEESDDDSFSPIVSAEEVVAQHPFATWRIFHFAADGSLAAYTSDEASRKAIRPADASWDNAAMQWTDMRPATTVLKDARSTYEAAAQSLLDATAQAWGYDSVLSAASYTASTVARFKAEADCLVAWRDALWSAAYALEEAVAGGTQPLPATVAEFLSTLPSAPTRPSSAA